MVNGSIQEKNGRLYAVLSIPTANGKYKQKWVAMGMKSNESKRKQKERLDEIRLEYSQIICVEAAEIKFCDFIRKWNEETKASKSITTYDGYVHMIDKYVFPYFNERGYTLSELRPCDIDAYYKWLQKDCGLAGNTALKHHQIIHTSLKYAVFNRVLKENPAEFVKRPKKERVEHDFYNAEELKALMTAAKGDPLEHIIFLTILFGLRREEILGLKWCNIDFDKRIIYIRETVVRAKQNGKLVSVSRERTKSETSNRQLRISDKAEKYLKQIQAEQLKQRELCGDCYTITDFVCTDKLGVPTKPDYVTQRFSKVLKKHGLRHIKFHDLRHSSASYMIAQGYSLKDIQEFLGHSNYNFTADTYVHVDDEIKQNMADTISDDLLNDCF